MKEAKQKTTRKSQRTYAICKSNDGESPTPTTKSDTSKAKRTTHQNQGPRKRNTNRGQVPKRTKIKKDPDEYDDSSRGSSISIDTFSSDLSEFMTTTEEEPEPNSDSDRLHDYTNKKIEKSISNIFPLGTIDSDKVTLIRWLDSKILNKARKEYTFQAKYTDLDVYCTCITPYRQAPNTKDNEYYHAFQMSEELLACRNMASYLGVFITNDLKKLLSKTTQITADERDKLLSIKQPALFIVKPWFRNGSLADYLQQKRSKSDSYIEPLYVLQMAITLFGMLSDAHKQDTALVDISLDTLYVGDDDCLYFGGFQHCIFLDDTFPTHQKSWINMKELIQLCPEFEQIIKGNSTYKRSMDIFLASNLVLEIMKDINYRKNQPVKKRRLYRENNQHISVIKEAIDPRHSQLIEVLEKGLSYNPKDRPSASDILYWLVTIRNKSLNKI